jgi:hypothetical protein
LKNVFKNLGVVSTPLKCLRKWFYTKGGGNGEKGVGGFCK